MWLPRSLIQQTRTLHAEKLEVETGNKEIEPTFTTSHITAPVETIAKSRNLGILNLGRVTLLKFKVKKCVTFACSDIESIAPTL